MPVDARGFNLDVNVSPVTDAVGSLISQRIMQQLGQKAMSGDAQAYAGLAARDPKAAMAIGSILQNRQQGEVAQQEASLKQQKAEQEKQKQHQEMVYAVARGYKAANDKGAFLANAAMQLQQSGQADLAKEIAQRADLYATDPGAVEKEADAIVGMFSPEKAQSISPVGDLMRERDALPEGDPRRATYDAAIKKAVTISDGQNVTVSINDGKQDLTKTTASGVQEKVLDAERSLSDLSAIANSYSGDFLTYEGRAKSFAGGIADRAGFNNDLTKFNASREKFKNSVNQFFNQYKKEITGSAAGEQEMIDLRNSMFNEKLGPQQFKAAFDQFVGKARKNYELNKRTARTGVDVAVDPKYKDMSDAELKKALGL